MVDVVAGALSDRCRRQKSLVVEQNTFVREFDGLQRVHHTRFFSKSMPHSSDTKVGMIPKLTRPTEQRSMSHSVVCGCPTATPQSGQLFSVAISQFFLSAQKL